MKITVEEIKHTAIALFLEKGYNNVTIQDICDELHITKPTLYKYVRAKEDLVLDLYDQTINKLVQDTYRLVDSDSHYQQLLIIFSTLMSDTKKYGYDLFSQLFIANLKENRKSFEMRESLTKLCIIIIKKAQEKKEVRNQQDPAVLYKALAHLFTGYEVIWCINKDAQDFSEDFYQGMNAILDVAPQYAGLYKEYQQ
jgi:AcrR family transcriptional regulator